MGSTSSGRSYHNGHIGVEGDCERLFDMSSDGVGFLFFDGLLEVTSGWSGACYFAFLLICRFGFLLLLLWGDRGIRYIRTRALKPVSHNIPNVGHIVVSHANNV